MIKNVRLLVSDITPALRSAHAQAILDGLIEPEITLDLFRGMVERGELLLDNRTFDNSGQEVENTYLDSFNATTDLIKKSRK